MQHQKSGQYKKIGLQCNMDNLTALKDVETMHLGKFNLVCKYCGSLGFKDENRGTSSDVHFSVIFCNKGKTELPDYPPLSEFFLRLYQSNDVVPKFFPKNIRKFNSAFSMASMVASDETVSHQRGGIASFRIRGQLYRFIGNIRNTIDSTPRYLQTYFYDPEDQAQIRSDFYSGGTAIERERYLQLFTQIHTALMNSPNNYIDSFLSADEIIQNMSQTQTEIRISIHADVRPSNEHIRRYNLPSSSEISILMPEDVAENENREVICLYR